MSFFISLCIRSILFHVLIQHITIDVIKKITAAPMIMNIFSISSPPFFWCGGRVARPAVCGLCYEVVRFQYGTHTINALREDVFRLPVAVYLAAFHFPELIPNSYGFFRPFYDHV